MHDIPIYTPGREVRQREPRMKNREYLDWVAAQGICQSCGVEDGTIVPAHYRPGRLATGMKPDDWKVAALCKKCHDEEKANPVWWAEHVLTHWMRVKYDEWRMAR